MPTVNTIHAIPSVMTYTDPHHEDEPLYECLDCGNRPEEIDGRLCPDCGGYLSNIGMARD
jgi:hypothetical protein